MSQSGTLDISTTGSTDTYGYLRDSSCAAITSNNDGGGSYSTNFHISRGVFAALAAGPHAGLSVLGTPMGPLPDEHARAVVAVRRVSGPPRARRRIELEAVVHNRGPGAWPAWTAGGWDRPGLVRWEAHWRPRDGDPALWVPAGKWPLRHDVAAGAVLSQRLSLPAPDQPGPWQLRIVVRQLEGTDFSGPGNAQTLLPLEIAP